MDTITDITTCSTNLTAPVNVLFVGHREVSEDLIEHMNDNGYTWDLIAIKDLQACIRNRKVSGVVVIDAGLINPEEAQEFRQIFRNFDQKDVPVLLFNCPDFIDTGDLQLSAKIKSVAYEEIWGRIESNIRFYRRLQADLAKKERHICQLKLNKDTAEQLEMAGRVQRNFLPARLPHTPRIRWATVFRPAEWVSGDIYDITRLDEDHIGFYLADAVGHSMPAALLTMFLKQAAVMRQTINNDYYIFKPWEMVTTLNLRMSEQELTGCLFATCFYGLLNINTLQLQYSRAGHPYPVLIRNGEPIQMESRGGLLGVFPEAEFEQKSIQLETGDKLFVFSDGGEPLIGTEDDNGQFHFNEPFKNICVLPIEAMLQAYNQMAAEHRFTPAQVDDVTAVGLEIL